MNKDDRAAGSLGGFYKGWQQYADSFQQACREAGVKPLGMKPSHGYLRIDTSRLPEHLTVLADAIERASDGVCQFCGATNAVEHVERDWIWKLCKECRESGKP